MRKFRKSMVKTGLFLLLASWLQISLADEVALAGEVDGNTENPAMGSAATYRIGPGDVLEISVWKEEDMEKQIIVPPDGVVAFPHSGSFNINGKTIDEVKNELVTRLEKIIVDPVVTVYLQKYDSQKVYVVGKVNRPGEFPLTGPVDVMQALAMAGGMAQFADLDSIQILRRMDGKSTAIPFDYSEVMDGENLDQNIVLQKGDVVVVP